MTRQVLLTGGSGFIGQHLARKLRDSQVSVRSLDVRPSPVPTLVEESLGDVRDLGAVINAMDGVQTVYHLASSVGVETCLDRPIDMIETAVTGTSNVLTAATMAGARVVVVSSSEVLGVNPVLPWDEEAYRILGPTSTDRWGYASAKAVAEHLAFAWHRQRGTEVAIVRPFNVYGPGQPSEFVVPRVISAVMEGRPVPISGDGRSSRSFTFVDDVVAGLVRVADSQHPEALVYHLGSEIEHTVNDLVHLVRRILAVDTPLETVSVRADLAASDVARRQPDASRAASMLDWRATTTFHDGLARTIAWYQDHAGLRVSAPIGG